MAVFEQAKEFKRQVDAVAARSDVKQLELFATRDVVIDPGSDQEQVFTIGPDETFKLEHPEQPGRIVLEIRPVQRD